MYSIYAYNCSNEDLGYSHADGYNKGTICYEKYLLYSPKYEFSSLGYIVGSATLDLEQNSSGTMSLTLPTTHPVYKEKKDILKLLTTAIVVFQDEEEIWRGRIIDVTTDFYGSKEYTIEGELGFLGDVRIFAKSDHQGDDAYKNVTEYIEAVIDDYNDIASPYRKIELGTIAPDSTDISSWMNKFEVEKTATSSVLDILQNDIIDQYGGVFKLDYIPKTDSDGNAEYDSNGDAVVSRQLSYYGDKFYSYESIKGYINSKEALLKLENFKIGEAYEITSTFKIVWSPSKGRLYEGDLLVAKRDWDELYKKRAEKSADHVRYYFDIVPKNINSQSIVFGKNLTDLNQYIDSTDIYTAVLGYVVDENETIYGGSENLPSDDEKYEEYGEFFHNMPIYYLKNAVDTFGFIEKVVKFDYDTIGKSGNSIMRYCLDLLDISAQQALTIEINAIDLGILYEDYQSIRLNDLVAVTSKPHGLENAIYQCTAISMDLMNPNLTTYTFGPPPKRITKQRQRKLDSKILSIT